MQTVEGEHCGQQAPVVPDAGGPGRVPVGSGALRVPRISLVLVSERWKNVSSLARTRSVRSAA